MFSSVVAALFPVVVGGLAQWRWLRLQDYFGAAECSRLDAMVRKLTPGEGLRFALVLYLLLLGNVALLGYLQSELFLWANRGETSLPFFTTLSTSRFFPYVTSVFTSVAATAIELTLLLSLLPRETARRLLLCRIGGRAGYVSLQHHSREVWLAVAVAVLVNVYGETRVLRITADGVAYRGWTDVALVKRPVTEVDSVIYKRAYRNPRGGREAAHIIISFRDGTAFDTRDWVDEANLTQMWGVLAGQAGYRDKVFRSR